MMKFDEPVHNFNFLNVIIILCSTQPERGY